MKEYERPGPERCATCPAWMGCPDNPEYRPPKTPDGVPADVEKTVHEGTKYCTLAPEWLMKSSFEWCMNHPDNIELMGGFEDEDDEEDEDEDDEDDEEDEDEEEEEEEQEDEVQEIVRRRRRRTE